MKIPDRMYEAGMKYMIGKGTAWCINDLFEVMWKAIPYDSFPVHAEFMSNCCGIFDELTQDGLICNECRMTLDEAIEKQYQPRSYDKTNT